MIQPAFTGGLPPDGAEGLFLACDSDGMLWLLRWDATRFCYAVLGWPTTGNPEQHYLSGGPLGLLPDGSASPDITGHQLIAWTPAAPPEEAGWAEVAPADPAALPAPEA